MRVWESAIPDVLIIEPPMFRDQRGGIAEWWHKSRYAELGVTDEFVQDNISWSTRGVLRGLHYQNPRAQSKLITVPEGIIYDVAVDLRVASGTFGKWIGVELSSETLRQLYIPAGFAHGFQVLSDVAVVSYKCSDYYSPECERVLRWDDPEIGIRWPIATPVLSTKDSKAPFFCELPPTHCF